MINESEKKLTFLKKAIYGSGDLGRASFNTLRLIFYAIFLTDVVGLDPRLASFAAVVSLIWDAINDPLVGMISDNIKSRWGRRRPFFLFFSIPFAAAFLLMWWAPPWQSQILLMIHVTVAFMISDTIQTLVTVPYLALTPEVARGYDERTSLTSYRMFFNLLASLSTAVAAPSIVDMAVNNGLSLQQGYLIVAAMFGGLAVLPLLLIFFFIKETPPVEEAEKETISLTNTLKILWSNRPFRYATSIYVLNWVSFDIVSLMLPYFLLYWFSGGNLTYQINLAGIPLSVESATLGVMLLTATITIPFWNWLAQKTSKRTAYMSGMILWLLVQLSVMWIQPFSNTMILLFAFVAGIFVSTAHVMPEAIFPDVIDWDELRTKKRREGIYYGAIFFIRKFASAIATFIALQILGWVGYQTPPAATFIFQQSEQTTFVIRLLTGPIVSVFLLSAILTTWFYPLTRERQNRIRRALNRKKMRALKKAMIEPIQPEVK